MRLHEGQGDLAGIAGGESCADPGERAQTLRSLAKSLLAVANQIDHDSLIAGRATLGEGPAAHGALSIDKRMLLDRAALDYGNRRARRRFFPAELFGEPAWDLLLDLFQARLEGKSISVTSACIGADVPLSTALRWIGVLETEGLVERSRNLTDHRSTWVSLTDRAVAAMTEYTQGCLIRGRRAVRRAEEDVITALQERAA